MLQIGQDTCIHDGTIAVVAAVVATDADRLASDGVISVEVSGFEAGGDSAPIGDESDSDEFCDMLLAAMVAMAVKSKRRQADISAVMARNHLTATPQRLWTALQTLVAAGRVRDVVPLYDGGMLVTVTNTGMDLLGASRSWSFLQDVEVAAA